VKGLIGRKKMKLLRKNQEGATVVEFAIVLPLLFLFTFGIIEFSLLLYNKAMLNNACREGTRAAVAYSYNYNDINNANDDTYYPSDDLIKTHVLHYAENLLVTFGSDVFEDTDIDIIPPFANRTTAGGYVTLRLTYHYNFLLIPNFVTSLIGGVDLIEEAVMRLE
jgi:hypothetical protein